MPKITNPKPTTVIPPVLLTTKQAATALNVSERSVFSLLASGELKSIRIGSARRIRVSDLESFAAAGLERDGDVRGIYLQQRDQLNEFNIEWLSTEKSGWAQKNDENVRLLIDAYRRELNRLLSNRPLTPEWIQVLETAKPVIARVQSRVKEHLSELPFSDPKTLADRAYAFVVNAGYQFASSLGAARTEANQVIENDE